MKPTSQQGGYAFLIPMLAILLVAGSIIYGYRANLVRYANNHFQEQQQAYVDEVAASLLDWYQKNLFAIDKPGVDFDVNHTIDLLGIKRKWDVRAVTAPYPTHQGKVFARSIVVWLGHQGGVAQFDHGVSALRIVPARVTQKTVSTREIQTQAYQHAQTQLKQIALLLEAHFSAAAKTHSQIYLAHRFAPQHCAQVRPTEVTGFCVGTKQPVATLLTQLGADGHLSIDPWGGSYYYTVLAASPQTPAQVQLSTTTPWGSEIVVFATVII
ncbi:MAG: hypothetical protein IT497_06720 [Ottowia sp.]|nr:hypothetical protein [Ottowia sp.]